MRIGLDFDGTITDYPEQLKGLMELVGSDNCYIITGRHEGERAATLKSLKEFGISPKMYKELHMYPKPYKYNPVTSPGVWEDIIKFKVTTCLSLNIEIMVEDDERYKKPLEHVGVSVLLVE